MNRTRLLNFAKLVVGEKCIISLFVCFQRGIVLDIFSSFYPQEFLKKEFSEENVLFWLACEDFKKTQDKKQVFLPVCYKHSSQFFFLSL